MGENYLVHCWLSGCQESELQSSEQTLTVCLLAESVQNAMYC